MKTRIYYVANFEAVKPLLAKFAGWGYLHRFGSDGLLSVANPQLGDAIEAAGIGKKLPPLHRTVKALPSELQPHVQTGHVTVGDFISDHVGHDDWAW